MNIFHVFAASFLTHPPIQFYFDGHSIDANWAKTKCIQK